MASTSLGKYDADAFADPVGLEDLDRICPKCGKTKPSSSFASLRYGQCKTCQGSSRAKRIRKLKAALIRLAANQLRSVSRGDRQDAPRTSQICATMVDLFGGSDKFCATLHNHIQICLDDRPGSKTALDALRTVLGLIKDSTASIDAANTSTGLSDEELENAISIAMSEEIARMASNPLLIEEAMPDDCDDDAENDPENPDGEKVADDNG